MHIDYDVVRVLLAKKNMNRRGLADLSGVSRNSVYVICSGKSCSPETAAKLAAALNVPVEKIIKK